MSERFEVKRELYTSVNIGATRVSLIGEPEAEVEDTVTSLLPMTKMNIEAYGLSQALARWPDSGFKNQWAEAAQ